MRLALFVGDDLHSHILAHRLAAEAVGAGVSLHVYLPARRSSRRVAEGSFAEYQALEIDLLEREIYPALFRRVWTSGVRLAPLAFEALHGIHAEPVEDINEPAFLERLGAAHHDLAISVRCLQKFGREIIAIHRRDHDLPRLWNLHPGRLPAFRGVCCFFRQLAGADLAGRYTLHVVDPGWDTGPVILRDAGVLQPGRSVLSNYCRAAPAGARMILDAVGRFRRGDLPPPSRQDHARAAYWSTPTAEEIAAAATLGVRLADRAEVAEDVKALLGVEIGRRAEPG
ncbi:formyltransferase family protein [Albimonas pacifica]|uniref:Formyl transferase n=1 Tax=Albimonas pacifica TaxID=1114924 RepID=A0A1I3QDC2_9RHOB|nr:formyltransferase family protein [Albimonas pacifica]SFJ31106.1 Formyl transferase [Albimonas pacifica]